MPDHRTRLGRLFTDDTGKVVVWQPPNVPIVGWALFSVLAQVLPAGRSKLAAEYLGSGLLFTWAFLEITQGASYFRRILGAVILVVVTYSRTR